MDSSVVVKVKHGETLRRFNVNIVNNKLDLDMNGLRRKVLSLFNFPSDSELVLTYIDEDGDVVTLADEEDLHDIMRQSLNPLRISVRLSTERFGRSHGRSSGDSTPMQSPRLQQPFPNVNANVSEILKYVPEVIHELLPRLSPELGSNSTSSPPGYTEILDSLSKIGLTYLKEVAVSSTKNVSSGSSTVHHASEGKNSSKVDDRPITESRSNGVDQDKVTGFSKGFVNPAVHFVEKPIGKMFGEYSAEELLYNSIGQGDKVATNNQTDDKMKNVKKLSSVGVGLSSMKDYMNPGALDSMVSDKSGIIGAKNNMADYGNSLGSEFLHSFYQNRPFKDMPIENYSSNVHGCPYAPRVVPFKRSHSDGIKSIQHRGVRCDGCGVHPITGPRYKSKVKEDYDLCNVCFVDKGNDAEYIRMDHPMSYHHPASLMGFYNPHCRGLPPTLPQVLRGPASGSKLDSQFIQDVSIRDGTFMAPSTPFTKIWRLKNNGNTVWPRGTQLLWIGGDRISETLSVELEIPADGWPVDKEIDIAVEFKAPEGHGRFISYWRMASPSGQKFGQRVWVLIQVDDSLKDSFSGNVRDFNLNFPPFNGGVDSQVETSFVSIDKDGLSELNDANKTTDLVELAADAPTTKDKELNFPINDSLLVGEPTPAISYPTVDFPVAEPNATNSVKSSSKDVTSSNESVEEMLLKELEDMGFKQVDLNKEILRMNEYNLERSVDDLCGVAKWDPRLEELQEMGFVDKEMNKVLLKKNNGSIKRVVMDLIAGEKRA